jgi:hypothetical protein
VTEFDAQWLIERTHTLAGLLGAERVRLDRGVWSVAEAVRYYEVGYGPLFTVTITSNKDSVLRFTKETWRGRASANARLHEFLLAVSKGEK